jgi:hypothetical protein
VEISGLRVQEHNERNLLAIRAPAVTLSVRPVVEVQEVALWKFDAKTWDDFAALAGCSVRGTHSHARGWAVKNFGRGKLLMFEFFIDLNGLITKIGQCSIGQRAGGVRTILDRLQVHPSFSELWPDIMEALLSKSGTGIYEYGWELSLESPRLADIQRIAGVKVRKSVELVVHAVDFSRWKTWEDYYWDLRKGTRQAAQFAYRDIPDLRFRYLEGWAAIRNIPPLIKLKLALSSRKNLGLNARKLAASYLGWIAFNSRYLVTNLARGFGRNLAIYYGTEFGVNSYYLEAAAVRENKGAQWALLLEMMRRAYERQPTGKFIMGYTNYATHEEDSGGGLVRSRQACRVTNYDNMVVIFDFQPPPDNLDP